MKYNPNALDPLYRDRIAMLEDFGWEFSEMKNGHWKAVNELDQTVMSMDLNSLLSFLERSQYQYGRIA